MNTPSITRRAMLTGVTALAAPHIARAVDVGTLSYWSMWSQGEPQQKVIAAALELLGRHRGQAATWVGRNNLQRLAPTLNTANVPADIGGA